MKKLTAIPIVVLLLLSLCAIPIPVLAHPAPPAYQNMSEVGVASATEITIPAPGGFSADDLFLVFITKDDDVLINEHGDWTTLHNVTSGVGNAIYCAWRIAQVGDTSWTWTGDAEAYYGAILRFTGHDGTTPINISDVAVGDDATPTAPDVLTTIDDCMIFQAFGADDDDVPYTVPGAPFAQKFNDSYTTTGGAGGVWVLASQGQTGDGAFGMAASEQWGAVTVAIQPASPPLAPTNVSATDGDHTDKVVITWTKSAGATKYEVFRDDVGLGELGDIATFDDSDADAPTITGGNAVASDGLFFDKVALSLSGASANNGTTHTYKVKAGNAIGWSGYSDPDTGYRGVGSLTYQWQRSADDSDADYSNIDGATTANYDDTEAPENGAGRYYKCLLNATGATQKASGPDRGFRDVIIILAANPPTVTNSNADIDGTSATLNGNITDTGNGTDDIRGFVWDTVTHADPGNTAPGASAYSDNWTESGSFGTGAFDYEATGLTALVTYYFRACAHNDQGWAYSDEITFFALVEGKVYLELRPDLSESRITGNAANPSIPTDVNVGLYFGFSMPIWNEDEEELYFIICVPDRWDGESHILVYLHSSLANAGEEGNSYQWEITWDKVTCGEGATPTDITAPPPPYVATVSRTVYSNTQYEHYKDWLIILYNADVDDDIEVDDLLALRLRRIHFTDDQQSEDELNGELIIHAIDILFVRGDFLGDPTTNVTNIINILIAAGDLIGGADMLFFALIFLALGFMIACYVFRRMEMAFAAAGAWIVLGVYCLGQSTSASPASITDIYMALFWLCIGLTIVSAMMPLVIKAPPKELEDEPSLSDMEKAKKDIADIENETDTRSIFGKRRKPRQSRFSRRGED